MTPLERLTKSVMQASHDAYLKSREPKVVEYDITTKGKVVVKAAIAYAVQNLPPVLAREVLALEFPDLTISEIKSLYLHCRDKPWGSVDEATRTGAFGSPHQATLT